MSLIHHSRVFVLFVFLVQSSILFGHAVVTESSLARQSIQPQTPSQLILQFNSEIEPSLSKVFLVSEGDKKQPVEFKKGPKPGQLIVQLPPLGCGSYALNYKIFAADGHLTEDVLRFSVAMQKE